MSHSYRVSSQSGVQIAMPSNVYSLASEPTTPTSDMRKRHNSSSAPRHPSILSGLRNLMVRPRSESLNSQMMRKPPRPMKKVQIAACQLESVYDLREGDDEGSSSEFYNDEWAFRRPRSNSSDFLILRKTSRPLSVDVVGLVDSQSDPYRQYMKVVECYELASANNTITTIDSRLTVDKAFNALCTHNIGSALIWDADLKKNVSIVTLSDFLRLHALAADPAKTPVSEIVGHGELVQIPADFKIYDACEIFCNSRVHRLVVTEPGTGDVLFLLTLKRVLQAIHKQNRSLHFAQWLSCPISDSCVGSWNTDIYTVPTTETVAGAVTAMLEKRISGLPLVDQKGRVVDVLVKSDLAKALERTQRSIHTELLASQIHSIMGFRPPATLLSPSDSVGKVLDTLLCGPHVRSVFIINEAGCPIACVSLSDVIRHLTVDGSPFARSTPEKKMMEDDDMPSPFSP